MKLRAVLFKTEQVDSLYRYHFIVYAGEFEVTRFGLEFNTEPSREELAKNVEEMLEEVGKKLPTFQETLVVEKDVHS